MSNMSDALVRITELAKLLEAAKRQVEVKDQELKDAKEEHRRLEREALPELMRELELTSITLEDGSTVTVQDDVECGISEERKPEAHAWLAAHNFGGLIKTSVSIAFGRGERDEALHLQEVIKANVPDRPVDLVESVHWQTLKAFVKEQLAAGRVIPFDLFGVVPFPKATVKLPSTKGKKR